MPQTGWAKAELLADDQINRQIGDAIDTQLRMRGYQQTPGGAYAVRLEMRGRGLTTPSVPIPGYDGATPRLSIWSETDQPNAVYISLLVYHQSTGQVVWQGEAMCPGLPADARNIVNAMVVPLLDQMGVNRKARLDCRNL